MSDVRPGFTIARCCRNCQFYRANQKGKAESRVWGICNIAKLADKTAAPLPTHSTAYCDAHIWRTRGITVHRMAMRINATPPEGTL